MAWDFETPSDLQTDIDWIDQFVREKISPIDDVISHPLDMKSDLRNRLIKPLQQEVKQRGLWAFHLGEELGGPGLGQLPLALINEQIGRSRSAPVVFGCHAPDSGNAEVLAHYGTPEQKKRYLAPLLANELTSTFAMTEPQGGSDPTMLQGRAELRDGKWVLNGEKWFATNAPFASFYITMLVTEPDAQSPYQRASMFIVPADTKGVRIIRDMGVVNEAGPPSHSYIAFENAEIPEDLILGGRGKAFEVAQVRLGGGRIHHAMRVLSQCQVAFDMMCERAVSRFTKGERLSEKQLIQEMISESWLQIEQFRLFLLKTAWLIDKTQNYKAVRKDIAAVKILMPRVLHDVASRALQIHGSLGMTNEVPLMDFIITSYRMGIVDGATEVHKVTLAKQLLRGVEESAGLFPSHHKPALQKRSMERLQARADWPDLQELVNDEMLA